MKYYPPLNSTDPNAGYENADEVAGKFENCLPDARGFEATQREIVNAVTAAGLTPTDNDLTQLSQAIGKVAADNDLYGNESIKNTITAAGLTFDKEDKTQLKTAVEVTAEAKADYATKSIENTVTGFGFNLTKDDYTQLKQAIEKHTSDESSRIINILNRDHAELEAALTSMIEGKLDTSLANLTQAAKNTVISMLLPDYSAGRTVSTAAFSPTVPGWLFYSSSHGDGNFIQYISVNGQNVLCMYGWSGTWSGTTSQATIPLGAGDNVNNPRYSSNNYFFFPCKGAA